jgi:hypothetical protein
MKKYELAIALFSLVAVLFSVLYIYVRLQNEKLIEELARTQYYIRAISGGDVKCIKTCVRRCDDENAVRQMRRAR